MRQILALVFSFFFLTSASTQGRRIYVDAYATGASNGRSWYDAFTNLQSALSAAQPGDSVWVSLGIYTPDTGRAATFQIKSGVQLYGGFAGVETRLEQRNWSTFRTLLKGIPNVPEDTSLLPQLNPGQSSSVIDGFIFTASRSPIADAQLKKKKGISHILGGDGAAAANLRNCTILRRVE